MTSFEDVVRVETYDLTDRDRQFERRVEHVSSGVRIWAGNVIVGRLDFPVGSDPSRLIDHLHSRMVEEDGKDQRRLILSLIRAVETLSVSRYNGFSFFHNGPLYDLSGRPGLFGILKKIHGRTVLELRTNVSCHAAIGCPEGCGLEDMENYVRSELIPNFRNENLSCILAHALHEIGVLRGKCHVNVATSQEIGPSQQCAQDKNEPNYQRRKPSWLTERMCERLIAAAAESFDEFKMVSFGHMSFYVHYATAVRIFELEGPSPVPQDEIVRAISLGISEHGDCCFKFANALIDSTGCDDVLEEADIMSKKDEKP